jgi:hypothetical protein
MLTGGRVAETEQVHPPLGAGQGPGLSGDPGPQGRRRVNDGRRRWRRTWVTGGLGSDGHLDRMPQPTHLDLNFQGEPAGEPVGIQQQQEPRGDRGHLQLGPQPRGGGAVDRSVLELWCGGHGPSPPWQPRARWRR